MPSRFRHACRFLMRSEHITDFLTTIEKNAALLRKIRRALPPPLDEHCRHATLETGVLTLVTDSPVWSSRLRFFVPELERSLTAYRGAISAWHIRVQPRAIHPATSTRAAREHKISAKMRQHLTDVAAGIEDEEIASALRRLAKAGAADC